jgi:hypothetical protein
VLLQLAQLPALKSLALMFGLDAAAAAAQTWRLLPQLRELRLWQGATNTPDTQHVAKILSGAAAATGLTSLELTFRSQDSPTGVVAACAALAGLKGLRQLRLEQLCLAPGEVLFLTALTGLTHLVLDTVDGVSLQQKSDGSGGEVAVRALARSMTQLRHLALKYCEIDLSSMEVMTAIGQLRQLTTLMLTGNSGLTEQGLMQLTGLTRLQQLCVDAGLDEALSRLWNCYCGNTLAPDQC